MRKIVRRHRRLPSLRLRSLALVPTRPGNRPRRPLPDRDSRRRPPGHKSHPLPADKAQAWLLSRLMACVSHKGDWRVKGSHSRKSNLLLQRLRITAMDLLVGLQCLTRPRHLRPRQCQRRSVQPNIAFFLYGKISVGPCGVEPLSGLLQGLREARLFRARLLHPRTLACAVRHSR
jgi:hypothetical protein